MKKFNNNSCPSPGPQIGCNGIGRRGHQIGAGHLVVKSCTDRAAKFILKKVTADARKDVGY